MRILFMWCYLCLFSCQQNKQVVSDKEQKTISFCASKSDIQDAAELNLNIIDYIKMNDKVKEIRRASIIMSQYITLDKVNRKYSVDISETKALELGVNKMNYDRVVLEIENVNKLLVDNPDVELIDLKLQYKEYKEKVYFFTFFIISVLWLLNYKCVIL